MNIVIPPTVLNLIGALYTTILNPVIAVLFAVALAVFAYGIVQFIWNPDNEAMREQGKRNMIYGIIGLAIMSSVFGIMRFIVASIGADSSILNYL